MTIPFSNCSLVLKQVRLEELEPIERANLMAIFPGYAGDPPSLHEPQPDSPLAAFATRKITVVTDNAVPRRFAGDGTLPRGRYHTVCRNGAGDDDGTLCRELLAYSLPSTGYFGIYDSTGDDVQAAKFRKALAPGRSAVFCVPLDRDHLPSPYWEAVGLARPAHPNYGVAVIPLRIQQVSVDRVIDLRIPQTQRWFTSELTRLTVQDKCVTKTISSFPLSGPLDDFTKLLPALLAQSIGDSRRVTQIAGLWLRRCGAHGLIFPSARSNLWTRFANGSLIDWSGWNFVDYRGSPMPTVAGGVDLSPEWEPFPLDGGNFLDADAQAVPIVAYTRVRIQFAQSGHEAGSLSVEGIEEMRADYHGVGTWFSFVDQIRERHGSIDADALTSAFLSLAARGRTVQIDDMAKVALLFIGATLGNSESMKVLHNFVGGLRAQSKRSWADAIERLLNLP